MGWITTTIVIIGITVFLWTVSLAITERKRLDKISSKSCRGFEWQRTCTQASPDQIRAYLKIVHEAFCLDKKRWLRLGPNTLLMDIYHAVAPGFADNLELETLALSLEEQYHFDLSSHWRKDLTLGDLFSLIRARDKASFG